MLLHSSFVLQDLVGASIALVLFAFVFVVPGYVAGWALNMFDFRRRLAATQLVIALVLSMAMSPILTFLAYRLGSAYAAFGLLAAFAAGAVAIVARGRGAVAPQSVKRHLRIAWLAAGCWSAFAILSLTDLQWGNRLYASDVSYDFATRVALINAISRTGVPPMNASWYPGHPVALTYLYYFWYVPCSLVEQLGGRLVDAHAAMIASVAWCGVALMGLIALYVRLRDGQSGAAAWRNALVGAGLLLVTGLDVIPVLTRPAELVTHFGDMEHWNEQITAWIGALCWVPHHVAALIACMAGVLVFQWMRGHGLAEQLKGSILAMLAFASAIGLSVFVTLVFVLFWGIWAAMLFFQGERRVSLLMAATGVGAAIVASPFLMGLIGTSGVASTEAIPIVLEVRSFGPVEPLIGGLAPAPANMLHALLLPLNYLMELGFFFISALLWAQMHAGRGRQRNPFQAAEMMLLAITLLLTSFARSTVIGSNDLGWRAWLPGQFVLLVWAIDVLTAVFPGGIRGGVSPVFQARRGRLLSIEIKALLIVGLLSTALDVAALRTWSMLWDAGISQPYAKACLDTQLGLRNYAAREAYDHINAITPRSAVVQSNPADLLNIPTGVYLNRQVAVSGLTAYGIRPDMLRARAASVSELFSASSWAGIDAGCDAYSIDVLVARDLDPIWGRLPALEQQRKPLFQNKYYAAFACGKHADR